MRRAARDATLIEWMREHAWSSAPIPPDEIEDRRRSAQEMRRHLTQLYDDLGESRLDALLSFGGRGIALVGLGALVVDLLSAGGATTTVTVVGGGATVAGGVKELIDVIRAGVRNEEKAWIRERWRDVDRYLGRLG
jgi:hypothetical protein